MIQMACMSPVGPRPWGRHTRWKPPANHSQVDDPDTLPPGPIGPGFISPSLRQRPAKKLRFCCSGPGLGVALGTCAVNAAGPKRMNEAIKSEQRLDITAPGV